MKGEKKILIINFEVIYHLRVIQHDKRVLTQPILLPQEVGMYKNSFCTCKRQLSPLHVYVYLGGI